MATTPNPHANTDRVLASGRIAFIDDRGRAELATCPWLVEVRNNNPEPDFPSDCYDVVPCGAPMFAVDRDIEAGWYCSNGHHHFTYGSARQQAEERLEAMVEVAASHDPRIAARLDAGESWQEVIAH